MTKNFLQKSNRMVPTEQEKLKMAIHIVILFVGFLFSFVFFFCKKFNIFLLKWKATHARRGKIIRVKTIGKNVQHSYFNPFCCCCRFVLGIATVNIVLYGTHKLLRIIKWNRSVRRDPHSDRNNRGNGLGEYAWRDGDDKRENSVSKDERRWMRFTEEKGNLGEEDSVFFPVFICCGGYLLPCWRIRHVFPQRIDWIFFHSFSPFLILYVLCVCCLSSLDKVTIYF